MVIVAGVLSAGWGFAFAYSHDPIIAAMKVQGASELAANVAVWAFALSGAVLPNLLYPAWLLTRNRSWSVLWAHPGETGLSVVYGVLFLRPAFCWAGECSCSGRWGLRSAWGSFRRP